MNDKITPAPLGNYRVKITETDGVGNVSPLVTSDLLTLAAAPPPSLAVTAPNGGESFSPNSPFDVSWTLSHPVSSGSFAVSATDAVGNVLYSLGSTAAVFGQTEYGFTWQAGLPAGEYRIAVTYNGTITDLSDATFTVQ